ncbi:MAG: serine/threonine protein kinase [Gemmataceae bacterium]|nr:serine/threonine protein kinase [Gemmataceae bacterium]
MDWHPSDEELERAAAGGFPTNNTTPDRIDTHLPDCPGCSAKFAALSQARRAAPDPFPDGTAVGGRYKVIRTISAGGQGRVYAACDNQLPREVAVKTIFNPARVVSFQKEAATLAKLAHPNIVRVYDTGFHGKTDADPGRPYIVMELLAHGTLADRLRSGGPTAGRALPAAKAIDILLQLADAVHYAHAMGIVHRDLKPANVLVERVGDRDVFKVADFGLTDHGRAAGTPGYKAPEQSNDSKAWFGSPADVYALGVILRQLLTGRLPGDGPQAGRPIPPALAAVCRKATDPDHPARYPSAGALADDLRNYQNRKLTAVYPDPADRWARRRWAVGLWVRRNTAGAVALAALVLIAAGAATFGGVYYAVAGERDAQRHTAEATATREKEQRERAEENEQLARRAFRRLAARVVRSGGAAALGHAEGLSRELLEDALRFTQADKDHLPDEAPAGDRGRVERLLGDFHQLLGDFPGAEAAYARALEVQQPLSDRDPSPRHLEEYARSLTHRGALRQARDLPAAVDDLTRATAAWDRRAGRPDFGPELLLEAAWAYLLLGEVRSAARNDDPGAEAAYREALRRLPTVGLPPTGVAETAEIAFTTWDALADVLLARKDHPAAADAYRRALDIVRPLTRDYPNLTVYREVELGLLSAWGACLEEAGDLPGAERQYREELDLSERLQKESGRRSRRPEGDYQRLLNLTASYIGAADDARPRDAATAKDLLGRAVALADFLGGRYGGDPAVCRRRVETHLGVADRLLGMGDHEQAVNYARAAAGVFAQVRKQAGDPAAAHFQGQYRQTVRGLAAVVISQKTRQPEEAARLLSWAAELQDGYAELFPKDPQAVQDWCEYVNLRGQALEALGRWREAADAYRAARDRFLKLDGGLTAGAHYLGGGVQYNLAKAEFRLGQAPAARASLAGAISSLQKAYAAEPSVKHAAYLALCYRGYFDLLKVAADHEGLRQAAGEWGKRHPTEQAIYDLRAEMLAAAGELAGTDQRLAPADRTTRARGYKTEAVEVLRSASRLPNATATAKRLQEAPQFAALQSEPEFRELIELLERTAAERPERP